MPRKALAGTASEPRIHDQSHRYRNGPLKEHRASERAPRRRGGASCLRPRDGRGRAGTTAYFGPP
jgi:hypothetical protein